MWASNLFPQSLNSLQSLSPYRSQKSFEPPNKLDNSTTNAKLISNSQPPIQKKILPLQKDPIFPLGRAAPFSSLTASNPHYRSNKMQRPRS